MTAEKLATQIGELIVTEIDDVERIEYGSELSSFAVTMENGKKFLIDIKDF